MMKIFRLLPVACLLLWNFNVNAQCTTTNATGCTCLSSGSTDCDLLPDIIVGRPPLLVSGSNGVIEYSQYGNGVENGRLRVSVTTPNIGRGPLEVRTTDRYICGTDTIVGTAPATCPNTGLPPRQLVVQRVYHKNGNTMTSYDRNAGSMTYHPTHGHMHVDDWGIYTLRSSNGDPNPFNWPIIGTGAKLAFCLMDYGSCSTYNGHCVDAQGNVLLNGNFPNYGLGGGAYNCSATVQGISSGYTDIYYQYLDGMYLTIPPGTCNGNYFIVVNIDPYNYFLEENENNNVIVVPYTLTKQAGTTPVITPSGSTSLCPGTSVTLVSSAASSYLWSTGATTQSITVSSAGTYTVTVDGGTACPASSLPLTVTTQSLPVTVTPVAGNICPGQNTTLNTNVSTPSSGIIQTSFSNNTQHVIPDNNTTGVVSPIVVSGINPTTLSSNVVVSVQLNLTHTYDGDLIVSLISPSGNTINLSNRRGGGGDNFNNTIFSMSATTAIASGTAPFIGSYIPDGAFSSFTGNVNGTWQLKVADVAAVDTGRVNSWSLTLNNVVPVQITYVWTSNPAGFTSSIANPVVTPSATTTYAVTVSTNLSTCVGTNSATVNVNPVNLSVSPSIAICAGNSTVLTASGASSYAWSPSTGLSSATGASVTANPTTTTTYNVTGTNATGCTAQLPVTVTVNPVPVVTLGSFSAVCSSLAAFTLTGGSPTGGTYSGPGVSNGVFSPATAGVGTHTIVYSYSNGSGCSSSASSTITVNNCGCTVPNTPGTMTGATKLCPGVNTVYSVVNVSTVTNYNWVVPAGVTIVSGQGTNSVTVNAGSTFTSGSICVYASNSCGTSAGRCKSISKNTASTPGAMIGGLYGHCNSVVNLSVNAVTGAVSYNWTLPAGTTLISGQGTNAISFSTPAGFVSGQVCVTSYNGCLNSTARCATIYGAPVKPVIGGENFACPGETKTYFISPSYGATNYNWTTTTGHSVVSGQGTTTAQVLFGSSNGSVRCIASNACGNRGTATLSITISCLNNSELGERVAMEINPNPASESAELILNGAENSQMVLTITNVLGKNVVNEKIEFHDGENIKLDLSNMAKGIYLVTVKNNSFSKATRLIIQ